MLSVKGASSTESGVTVSFPDKSLITLNLSPRIGFWFELGSSTTLDLGASYNMVGWADWKGTLGAGGSTIDITNSIELSYFAVMLRIGQSF
jgi:hypothetical protein